jgi:arginyl-tRNA synthetase
VIPGDLSTELAAVLSSSAATGSLPPAAAALTAHGTWRSAKPYGPARTYIAGSYASSLPFELARLTSTPPERIAARLAEPLAELPWVDAAIAVGGYLTVMVTTGHLASLPARIVAAGHDSARSRTLAGHRITAPHPPDLATSPDWPDAWRAQRDAVVGRLGHAAGADVLYFHSQTDASISTRSTAGSGLPPVAIAYYGADAVRYALARTSRPRPSAIESQLARPLDLSNPYFLVRYAHASAASTLRWAGDLGLIAPGSPPPADPVPELWPAELDLIDAMSWLPERVAAAHRRRRPAELTAHLEFLAGAWLGCSERHPALPFGGRGAPVEPAGAAAVARLELAAAVRTTLAASLGLLTVAAPAMM